MSSFVPQDALCMRTTNESKAQWKSRVSHTKKGARIMQNEQREQVRKRREKNWLCQCATKFMNFKCKYIHIFSMLYYLWNSLQSIKQIFMSNIYRMRCACVCCCALTLGFGMQRERGGGMRQKACTFHMHTAPVYINGRRKMDLERVNELWCITWFIQGCQMTRQPARLFEVNFSESCFDIFLRNHVASNILRSQ